MALRNTTGGAYSAASVRNNNGTIVKAGNVSSDGPITKVLGLNDLADDKGEAIGSKADYGTISQGNTGDKAGVQKAVSAGTLAFNASATQWVMQGGNVSTTIGGVANTSLVGGARDYDAKRNDFLTEANRVIIDTELVGASGFDVFAVPSTEIVPGRTNHGYAGNASTFVNPADGSVAVATEIAPSQAVPGELTYMFGAINPKQDDYKDKNLLES
jgi:hypothetical protein|tara:strand:+ start:1587 stop:2231 length:645 start_codon:yes stop_codon:yes gene_type:complete